MFLILTRVNSVVGEAFHNETLMLKLVSGKKGIREAKEI